MGEREREGKRGRQRRTNILNREKETDKWGERSRETETKMQGQRQGRERERAGERERGKTPHKRPDNFIGHLTLMPRQP